MEHDAWETRECQNKGKTHRMWEQEGNNTWTRTTNVSSRQDRESTQTLRRDAEDRTQRQDKDRLDKDHVK